MVGCGEDFMGTSSKEGENSKNEEDVKQLVFNLSFFKVVWNDRYLLVNCWYMVVDSFLELCFFLVF